MRVQSFPVEIRTVRPSHSIPRPQNNNNLPNATSSNATSGSNSSSSAPTQSTHGNPQEQAQGAQNQGQAQGPGQGQGQGQGQGGLFNFHNPNVEFFMEVTPEGITIDSLETTLVGSNEANDCKCCNVRFVSLTGLHIFLLSILFLYSGR